MILALVAHLSLHGPHIRSVQDTVPLGADARTARIIDLDPEAVETLVRGYAKRINRGMRWYE